MSSDAQKEIDEKREKEEAKRKAAAKRRALIATRNYVNAAKDIIDVGMNVVKAIHPAAATILMFAYIGKSYISVNGPDDVSDILEELKELKKKADEILTNMESRFTAFKAFYNENHFWNDVPLRTSVLYQYMLDLNTKPSADNLREFRIQYKKHDPVELARRLNYQLQREVMNPLETALNAEPLLTEETFKKWYEIIGKVFKTLWEIEIAAGIWIHDTSNAEVEVEEDPKKLKMMADEKLKKMDRVKDVRKEIELFQQQIAKWEDDYEKKSPYWPEKVRKLVEETMDKNKDKSIKEKAIAIVEGLAKNFEKFHTRSEMYVLVFPASSQHLSREIAKNQLLEVTRGNHMAIIYRSLEAYKTAESTMREAFTDLQLFHQELLTNQSRSGKTSPKDMPLFYMMQSMTMAEELRSKGCGCLVIVESNPKDGGVEVGWSKSTVHEQGCGEYVQGSLALKSSRVATDSDTNMFMFAGFK